MNLIQIIKLVYFVSVLFVFPCEYMFASSGPHGYADNQYQRTNGPVKRSPEICFIYQ